MPGAFHGIETASRALRAFQRQLDTIGHNVANVGTPGYTRQTVDLRATTPLDVRSGSAIALGTGVEVASINRIKAGFLTQQRDIAEAEGGRLDGGFSGLKSVEGLFLDTDGKGIGGDLDAFFAGWSKLASNPGEAGAKKEVQTTGRALALQVRTVAKGIAAARVGMAQEAKDAITDAEGLTKQIAALNVAIVGAKAKGETPNDLMDSRDGMVRSLSRLLGTTAIENQDGSVAVSLDGTSLVDGAGARPFPKTWDPATGTLTDGARTYTVTSGVLKGVAESDTQAASFLGRLDAFADNLRTAVNNLHRAGPLALPFFTDPAPPATGITAATLRLDAGVDADADKISTGASGDASDGSIALGLSRLKDTPIAALGGKTLGGYQKGIVTDIGRTLQSRTQSLDTHQAIVTQLDNRIQEVSGVSTDDEMAQMLKVQRSYQAAAKVLTMFDDNVGTLIGMLHR